MDSKHPDEKGGPNDRTLDIVHLPVLEFSKVMAMGAKD